jgi:hypothetical protein
VPTVCDQRVHIAIAVYVRERQPGAQVRLGAQDVSFRGLKRPFLRREEAREDQHE